MQTVDSKGKTVEKVARLWIVKAVETGMEIDWQLVEKKTGFEDQQECSLNKKLLVKLKTGLEFFDLHRRAQIWQD